MTKYEVSPLDGLRAALPDAEIVYVPGYSFSASIDEKDALDAATKADVVVFFGGLNKDKYNDAESYDREDWHLPYGHTAFPNGDMTSVRSTAASAPSSTI